MSYTIALAGNPNSGKTSLFNWLTGSKQHVGNWPGVTVDKKEGTYKKNKDITILDLPGTYSLSPYSAEEIIARDYITGFSSKKGMKGERPDAVINIVDGTNIERNLYLTLQIMETGIPVVIALNMMDEVAERGDAIDCEKLSQGLGVPVIPIVARNGKGLDELMAAAEKAAIEKPLYTVPKIYNDKINDLIAKFMDIINGTGSESYWRAVKLVEADDIVMSTLSDEEKDKVKKLNEQEAVEDNSDYEADIADHRYKYIAKLTDEAVKKAAKGHVETKSDKLDRILTNRYLAFPIFAVVTYLMFAFTFSENFLFIKGLSSPGIWLASLTESAWGILTDWIAGLLSNASDWVYSLVIDGIMSGVGAVIGFIPLVLVLYMLISFLEDCGYMARTAFVMDRIFRKFGLSGRSFIPLLMGFGCGVPAIMATRTLDTEKDRKITTIITGFMPCGAKMPIFIMFTSLFFTGGSRTLVTYSIYILSIVVAVIVSLILSKAVYKAQASNFIMELPGYRIPTLKSILIHGWEKIKDFAIKAGTVIFISTIFLWILTNFNAGSFDGSNKQNNEDASILCGMEESFLASAGNLVAPIFEPLGFGAWKPTVGVVTGWIAKENVVVTFAQLYGEDELLSAEADREINLEDEAYKNSSVGTDIKNKAAAYAYMAFNLLCMPCFAAVGAMKRELKTLKLTGFGILVQMLTAYIVSFLIYQIGSIF